MKILYLLLFLFFSSLVFSSEIGIPEQSAIDKKRFEERVKKISDKASELRLTHDDKISETEQVINSEEYLKRKNELSQKVALSMGFDSEEKTKDQAIKTIIRPLPEGHNPILFISSSMPDYIIHRYAKDLDKLGGTMILRGTLGGISKLMPTIQFISKISKINMDCIDTTTKTCKRYNIEVRIDPKRFHENNIHSVPALIFEKTYEPKPYCETGDPKKSPSIAYGDSSLEGLIQTLYELNSDSDLLLPLNILRGNQQKAALTNPTK